MSTNTKHLGFLKKKNCKQCGGKTNKPGNKKGKNQAIKPRKRSLNGLRKEGTVNSFSGSNDK